MDDRCATKEAGRLVPALVVRTRHAKLLRRSAFTVALLSTLVPAVAFAQSNEASSGAPAGDDLQHTLPGSISQAGKRHAKSESDKNDFGGSASDLAAANSGLFLGFSTYDGREVSGAGNVRVNDFKQFPGDLFHTDFVQRNTTAKDIEGALFGTLETTSLRPLDSQKPHIQAEIRGAYYPYAERTHQGLGNRISGSYTDKFDTGIGRIGISAGFLIRDLPQPREYYESGTNYKPCTSSGASGIGSYNASSTNPLYFASASATYRQERVREKVHGYFGQLEWQPSGNLDVDFDFARSHRTVTRYRGQLDLTDVWTGITPLAIGPEGELLSWTGKTGLEVTSFERTRDELYTSLGWNTRWQATDRLAIVADASFQRTHRTQTDISTTLDANSSIGPGGLIPFTITQNAGGFSSITFGQPVDLNNYAMFTDNAALRRGFERRVDRIWALRLDAIYQLGGFFTAVKMGGRYSDHIRHADLQTFVTTSAGIPASRVAAGIANCRISSIVNDFGSEAGTNIGSWAQFDPVCMFTTVAGSTDLDTSLTSVSGGGIEVHERIAAGYAMADFDGAIGATTFSGNVGVRVVSTDGSTRVYKYDGKAADLAGIGDRSSIINVLPSAHAVFRAGRGLTIHAGIARVLLRSNIEGFGLRRMLQGTLVDSDRPHPLLSSNADLNFEFRADTDTALLLGLSYKLLNSSVWPGDALIPGGPTLTPWLVAASKRGSYIRGVEVAVNRTFHTLPTPFDGLSMRASYAFYDSNFKFAEPTATDAANPLYLFTDPAGIPGLARHNVTAGAEYTIGPLRLGVRYDYDSGFFRPTGFTANRFRGSNQYLNANAAIALNAHAELLFTASNLTNQPEQYLRPITDNTGQTPYTGRAFTGALRLKY